MNRNPSTASLICLAIAEERIADAVKRIATEGDRIDMAEVRADYLLPEELSAIERIPRLSPVPLIFTIRRERDGGQWTGTEAERRGILARAAGAGYGYLDLESDVVFNDVETKCREAGTTIIRSIHDFGGIPVNLAKTVRDLPHRPGEIPKAAVMLRRTRDLLEIVTAFGSLTDVKKILIGMGPWGFATRILAGKLGSMLSFCSPASTEVAPGHIDPATLAGVYRFKSITPATSVYCVVANPVMHTKSPWIHNPALTARGLDAVYVPIQVDSLEVFFELVPLLDIKGVSVTVPHKSGIRRFLIGEETAVQAVGACNTVYSTDRGFFGANTDVPGFVASLAAFATPDEIKRTAVTVVGAGGTARAAAYALRQLGAEVLIVNRTQAKAKALAEDFGCAWAPLTEESRDLISRHSDIIVQTTSAGMHPMEDLDPLRFYDFSGDEIVYDVIYAPPETQFLKRARLAGCRTQNGRRMLLEQAYLQFKLFTGLEYPAECRDKAIS